MVLEDIFKINNSDDFLQELLEAVFQKSINKEELLLGETKIDCFNRFHSDMNINGFADLFYQEFSLEECYKVIDFFKSLNLLKESELFSEALNIYCRHKTNITQEEYQKLEPFDLSESEGERFDEISDYFMQDECGIYNTDKLLFEWCKSNAKEFGL